MLLDVKTKAIVEYSETSASPLASFPRVDAHYLGLGGYVVERPGGKELNALTGRSLSLREVRAASRDESDSITELCSKHDPLAVEASETSIFEAPVADAARAPYPVPSAEIKYRVPYYSLITGCNVLANNTGRCGWIVGSMIMRYWHARRARDLIPTTTALGITLRRIAIPRATTPRSCKGVMAPQRRHGMSQMNVDW